MNFNCYFRQINGIYARFYIYSSLFFVVLPFSLVQVILICFLSLIPWPAPSVFKISCSRDSARVVRKIVQSRWLPILEKYQVRHLGNEFFTNKNFIRPINSSLQIVLFDC